MSVRQRHNRGKEDLVSRYADRYTEETKNYRLLGAADKYGTPHLCGVVVILAILLYGVYIADTHLPPGLELDKKAPTKFSGIEAQKRLFQLTKIGPRPSGSYANDIEAVNLLVRQIEAVKRKARKGFDIEIDVHTSSGSFAFRHAMVAFTSAYENITNVVVKITGYHTTDTYLLANVHYDTVMNTEGASDDGVSCAILIEIMRAITQGEPEQLKHGLVFLFNGAEEGGLAGSHGFIKSHKWAPLVKAVVNIEAAGSGGRETVFQTGPQHPWILASYAKAAKYPTATVFAQEVFESGVIPSDTDFRVFKEYGNLVGIDLAFFTNGYVYHTRFDNASVIPVGSIQRAGENILQLIKTMAASDYLKEPGEYRHGDTVYYDVLGVFMVHYPLRVHTLLCYTTVSVIVFYILMQIVRATGTGAEEVTFGSVCVSACVYVCAIVSSFASAFTVAHIMVKTGAIMTWFTHTWFLFLLYGLPAVFGYALVYFIAVPIVTKCSRLNVRSFSYAVLLLNSVALALLARHGIKSSFILWLAVFFPFLLLCLPVDRLPFDGGMEQTGTYLLHLVGTVPHGVMTLYMGRVLYAFFVPLFGRTGTELPGDYLIAVLTALLLNFACSYLLILLSKAYNLRRFVTFVGILSLACVLYGLSGSLEPYAINEHSITPKRMFLQHTLRTFHASDGSVNKQDSGIWVQPFDYNKIKGLEEIPFYKNLKPLECEGSYCSLPYYYGKRKGFRKQWYLLGEKPELGQEALTTQVYKREVTDEGRIRFYFDIKGPDHMNLFLTLEDNAQLTDWSFYRDEGTGHMYTSKNFHEPERDVYIVFYSHGYHAPSWKFWLEIQPKNTNTVEKLAELGVARHYLHGKMARTRLLKAAISALPGYVCDNSWTSNYDSFSLT